MECGNKMSDKPVSSGQDPGPKQQKNTIPEPADPKGQGPNTYFE